MFRVKSEGGQYTLTREAEIGVDESYTFAQFVEDDTQIFAIKQRVGVLDTTCTLVLLQKGEGKEGTYTEIKRREMLSDEKDKSIYVAIRNEDMTPTMALAR